MFLSTNLPWQLDDYDQAKQAFTSFEMVREGDWLYQRSPHELVAQKPPLVGWVSSTVYELTRSWNFAWRFPSLLSAVAISIVLLRASTSAYGPLAGLISLSAFGLNLLSARLATLVTTDMPLALAISLIGLLIWRKVRKPEPWMLRDRQTLFTLLTVAMLIKGPIVYAFLLPGIAIFAWRARDDKIAGAWCGWWPWVGSLVVFLLWVGGGMLSKPGFYDQVVIREFLGRFSETIHRPQPVYFYVPHLLHKFAPWSGLMILLAVALHSETAGRLREAVRNMSPDIFWLICWSFGGLIVMSLVPSKRVDRIFPVVPPLCLLVGAQVARGLTAERMRTRVYQWSGIALLCSFLFTTGYSLWKIVPGYLYHRNALVTFSRAVQKRATLGRWRYEVVAAKDETGTEGMLLYLERLHFVPLTDAIDKWNSHQLEALVIPNDQMAAAMGALQRVKIEPLRTQTRKIPRAPTYVLVTQSPG